jgi:hypothetical protein
MTRWPFRFTAYPLLLHQVWGHSIESETTPVAPVMVLAAMLVLVAIAAMASEAGRSPDIRKRGQLSCDQLVL